MIEDISLSITEGRPHQLTASRLRNDAACFIDQFRHARDGFVMRNQHVFRESLAEGEAATA